MNKHPIIRWARNLMQVFQMPLPKWTVIGMVIGVLLFMVLRLLGVV